MDFDGTWLLALGIPTTVLFVLSWKRILRGKQAVAQNKIVPYFMYLFIVILALMPSTWKNEIRGQVIIAGALGIGLWLAASAEKWTGKIEDEIFRLRRLIGVYYWPNEEDYEQRLKSAEEFKKLMDEVQAPQRVKHIDELLKETEEAPTDS